MCRKCYTLGGLVLLVVGVLFLLRDLNVWNFWNIQWWTVVFVLAGACMVGVSNCPECQKTCCEPKKNKSR